jgi:hypothetical protein
MNKTKDQRRSARRNKKYDYNHRQNLVKGFRPPDPPPTRHTVAEDVMKTGHPRYVLAHEIDPSHTNWAWVPKKLRGVPILVPADFQKYRYAKRLADWMGQQIWWDDMVPGDLKSPGTWHDNYSQLVDRLAGGLITESGFSTILVDLAFIAVTRSKENKPPEKLEPYEIIPASDTI